LLADRGVMMSELIEAIYSLEEGIKAFRIAAEPGVLKVLIKP
jgi:threonine dehydrogenase-like Zn-dependent dehydrogenase